MKLSAQEEYGLRCLLHLARCGDDQSLTIPEISRAEGLSVPNVAKLMRLLRMGGMVQSARGQSGGYSLARPANQITIGAIIDLLGGPLFGPSFCERHAGREMACTHADDCSLRALWSSMQTMLATVLDKTTLQDLLLDERTMDQRIDDLAAAASHAANGRGAVSRA
ncbi:MAG: Rrf2 family transcriptional regulator [Bryobacteraceae bacterium]|nr:Rrf2 family transcriptional regulator [Bryobacteraceae bacterium]